jgi:hypothetical protein
MATKTKLEPQNPLILRSHRLMEAFAKSDDERDFYLDRYEGFIVYVDLDKPENELDQLQKELMTNKERYCLIPKLTFYEIKKIMEGFVNEKVYDIDTKEKLLDIIQSKEARDNFLEFIFDHHSEVEKWQLYYQERSRVRIIEWLRQNHFTFVFEEDLDLSPPLLEKVKRGLFDTKVGKEILAARKNLFAKSKTYYSSEALNPRPKRGRPPKQAVKLEVEPQITTDIYTTVPAAVSHFLFTPDQGSSNSFAFSSKFNTEEAMMSRKQAQNSNLDTSVENLNQKLAALRALSSPWVEEKVPPPKQPPAKKSRLVDEDEDEDGDDDDEDLDDEFIPPPKTKKEAPKPIVKLQPKAPVKPLVKVAAKPVTKPIPKPIAKPVSAPIKPSAKPPAKAVQPLPQKSLKKPTVPVKKAPPPPKKAAPPAKRPIKKIMVKAKSAPPSKPSAKLPVKPPLKKIVPKAAVKAAVKRPIAKIAPKKAIPKKNGKR